MAINTGSFAKALWPGVNTWYGDEYNEFPVEFTALFETNTSRKNFEEDMGYSGFGLASVKAEGSPIAYDTAQQGFLTRYNHVTYGLGFIITEEMMEDDLYDVIGKKRAQALAYSIRQTKEQLGANVYNRAFNGAYTGGDGVELCSSLHPNVAGGTFANELATPADLSEASLEQACIDLMGLEDDRGLRISVMPETLIIPRDLVFESERILMSTQRVDTANNDINALNAMGKFRNVVVNHYLTDADAWFIRTNVKDGPKYFERRPDKFEMDNDFDTSNAKFKSTFRCSFGWTDPRGIFGSEGA